MRINAVILFFTLLVSGPSLAAGNAREAPPWFEIEIIIFTRDLDQAGQDEMWPENPGTPDWANARPLQPGVTPAGARPDEHEHEEAAAAEDGAPPVPLEGQPTGPAATGSQATDAEAGEETEEVPPGPQPPIPYALLAEDEYRLTREYQRLQRTGGRLDPVVHLAWRQPVRSREQAELLYIRTPRPVTDTLMSAQSLLEEPPKLEGVLRVSVNRYLHVDVDLLRHERAAPDQSFVEPQLASAFPIPVPRYNSYRMQAHRRMRSGELHYLDHPLMGVLVQITPYELPQPHDEEEAEEKGPAEHPLVPEEVSVPPSTGTAPSPATTDTQEKTGPRQP